MSSDSGNSISPATSMGGSLQARKRVRYVLAQGSIIGGSYRIEKPLGHGGMGEVYLARHIKLDIYRAIKILLPKVAASDPVFATRFMQEARLAIQLQHPNIINVMDADHDLELDIYYIVMEYVDGGTVRHLIRKNGAFPEREALEIILRVGEALILAEKHKIVHRDIKPDNIMLTKDCAVKLADLGIAKSIADANAPNNITTPETLIGTPAYIAPEQAKDAKNVDCRADIYSLGVSLYEMLAAEKPYKGRSTIEILEQIFNAPVPDIRKKCPEISDATAVLLKRMMAKNRDERPRNWMLLCKNVSDILQDDSVAAEPSLREKIKEAAVGPIALGNKHIHPFLAMPGMKRLVKIIIPSAVGLVLMVGLLSGGTFTRWKENLTLMLIPGKYSSQCKTYNLRPPVSFIFMKDGLREAWINHNKPAEKAPQAAIPVSPSVLASGVAETPVTEEYKGRGSLVFELASLPEVEAWLKKKEYQLTISSQRMGKMTVSIPGTLEVPAGKYLMTMSLPECREFPVVSVDLKRDEQLQIKVNAVPVESMVQIVCNEPQYEVWWNNAWSKTGELRIAALQNFDLVIRAAGYRTFTSTVKLQPGENRKISVVLEPLREKGNYRNQALAEADAAYDKKNYATAKKLYLEEAEKGNPLACNRLGEIFEYGYGEWFANKEKAYRYYRMAADQDIAPAIFKVGEFHENGLGNVAKNEQEAVSWYRRGAELEDIECLNRIGMFYENGRGGLPREPETAISYYQRGAAKGNQDSQYLLGHIFELKMLMEPTQKNKDSLRKQARYWYGEAASRGSSEAQEKLRSL